MESTKFRKDIQPPPSANTMSQLGIDHDGEANLSSFNKNEVTVIWSSPYRQRSPLWALDTYPRLQFQSSGRLRLGSRCAGPRPRSSPTEPPKFRPSWARCRSAASPQRSARWPRRGFESFRPIKKASNLELWKQEGFYTICKNNSRMVARKWIMGSVKWKKMVNYQNN